jgi:uncharacterized protein YqjF (DUF2071 family)
MSATALPLAAQLPSIERRLAARANPAGRSPWMAQNWRPLLFLHWEVDSHRLQATLPSGLTLDTYDGRAYVGMVVFFMRGIRALWTPSLPGLSNFLELNVRTYVVGPDGTPGIWFYSLDCNQPLAVWGARKFYHLPYRHARMTADVGTTIDYRSQLAGWDAPARYRWTPRGTVKPSQPGTLDFFLVERYWLFANSARGTLKRGKVDHTPYGLCDADLEAFDTRPANGPLDGLLTGPPVHVCHSPGVDTRVFSLEPAG